MMYGQLVKRVMELSRCQVRFGYTTLFMFSFNCFAKMRFRRALVKKLFSLQNTNPNNLNALEAKGWPITCYYNIIRPWLEARLGCRIYTVLCASSQEGQKISGWNKYSLGAKEEAGLYTYQSDWRGKYFPLIWRDANLLEYQVASL